MSNLNDLLEKLHVELAKDLLVRIQSGEATAAEMANAIRFLKDNGIERTLNFANYMAGIEFINKLAVKAEEINHHPDLIVGWCKIQVRFSTHDLGGISTFDLKMAESSDSLFDLLNN